MVWESNHAVVGAIVLASTAVSKLYHGSPTSWTPNPVRSGSGYGADRWAVNRGASDDACIGQTIKNMTVIFPGFPGICEEEI